MSGSERMANLDALVAELREIGCHSNGEARCTCIIGTEAADAICDLLDRATPIPPSGDAEMTQAARDVLAERQRQVTIEGWSAEHDDTHTRGEMALTSACYALHGPAGMIGPGSDVFDALWPWADSWWKPSDRRRDLVKAGALILAEIERLDRATPPSGEAG